LRRLRYIIASVSAACVDSQFPSIPTLRVGPRAGCSRAASLRRLRYIIASVSAACVDSQFPSIPTLRVGPRAGCSRR
jgi:hypothetical protein